jgi:hypothetical protein
MLRGAGDNFLAEARATPCAVGRYQYNWTNDVPDCSSELTVADYRDMLTTESSQLAPRRRLTRPIDAVADCIERKPSAGKWSRYAKNPATPPTPSKKKWL